MQNDRPASLDEALQTLPLEVAPSRDLWSAIRSEIKADARGARNGRGGFGIFGQLAAAVVLMVATASVTYWATRESTRRDHEITAQANEAILKLTSQDALGPNYLKARSELDRLFAERVAMLPAATRVRLESNLADLRRAADDIAATLAEHPSDSLLQELLVSTRQRELQLLADVSRMSLPNS